MTLTPDVFIEQANAAVVPSNTSGGSDPMSGVGPVANTYIQQNPILSAKERDRAKNYTVDVFTTANQTFYTQYQNNMITPVAYRAQFSNAGINQYINTGNERGVFVVEHYNLIGVSNSAIVEFLEYYQDTNGIAYDDNVVDELKETIHHGRSRRRGQITSTVRIVTFIPIEVLVNNQYTYVMGPGVVIVHGTVPANLHHPYSPEYLADELLSPASDSGCVTIDISIVDSDNKPYYYLLGNNIRTIRPIQNKKGTVLPNGATIVTRRGSDVVDDKYFGIEDFEDNGFYRSKELCLSNGDKALLVEESKHQVELKKMEYELLKLKEANSKLILEKSARERQFELDVDKRVMELDYHKATKSIDLMHTANKFSIDLMTKRLDCAIVSFKVAVDIAKSKSDVIRANELHQIKLAENTVKFVDTVLRIFK